MIFITGDTHRDVTDFTKIKEFCEKQETTKEDLMIIAGDVGVNYNLDESDDRVKDWMENLPITFLLVRGNHEERPENIPTYKRENLKTVLWEGPVFREEEFPSLLFADNGLFHLEGKSVYIINGAYSVDKYYRVVNGLNWFPTEELTDEEMNKILADVTAIKKVDTVISHTCPLKYTPIEAFIPTIDRADISRRMEEFLGKVERALTYEKWYAGHWHIDKTIDKMRFIYNDIVSLQ